MPKHAGKMPRTELTRTEKSGRANRRNGEAPAPLGSDVEATMRTCPCGGGCPKCRSSSEEYDATPALVREALMSPGSPLDAKTRSFMEPRFGRDLGPVRVHTGAAPHRSAETLDARAYTLGEDIVFRDGEYAPTTSAGRFLLAHELTHVFQQEGHDIGLQCAGRSSRSSDSHEQSADRAASAVTANYRQFMFEGKTVTLSPEEYEREVQRAARSLRVDLGLVADEVSFNRSQHETFMRDIHGFAGIVSDILGDTVPPDKGIWTWPQAAIRNGLQALDQGRLDVAAKQLQLAQDALRDAKREWSHYIDKTTGGADKAITGLTYTRDISFAIAIGLAASVAAPAIAVGLAGAGGSASLGTAVASGAIVTAGGGVTGGVLRGGTSMAGQALAGGDVNRDVVLNETWAGFKKGSVDALTGAVGVGAGRALGLGAKGATLGKTVVKGGAAGMVSGAAGSATEAALDGKPASEILAATGKGALAGTFGGAFGAAGSHLGGDKQKVVKFLIESVGEAGGGAASALATGGSAEAMKEAAITSLISGRATAMASHPTLGRKKVPVLEAHPEFPDNVLVDSSIRPQDFKKIMEHLESTAQGERIAQKIRDGEIHMVLTEESITPSASGLAREVEPVPGASTNGSIASNKKGSSNLTPEGKREIAVSWGGSVEETVSTLIHEGTHALETDLGRIGTPEGSSRLSVEGSARAFEYEQRMQDDLPVYDEAELSYRETLERVAQETGDVRRARIEADKAMLGAMKADPERYAVESELSPLPEGEGPAPMERPSLPIPKPAPSFHLISTGGKSSGIPRGDLHVVNEFGQLEPRVSGRNTTERSTPGPEEPKVPSKRWEGQNGKKASKVWTGPEDERPGKVPAPKDKTLPQIPGAGLPHGVKIDVRNNYTYNTMTNEHGETLYRSARGPLGHPDHVIEHRSKSQQESVAGGTGDDAGHLIGNQFGASGRAENLTPQNRPQNQTGTWKNLEMRWADKLRQGIHIEVAVTDVFRPGEERPYMRKAEWVETAPDGTRNNCQELFANTFTPEGRTNQNIGSTVPANNVGSISPIRPDQ